MAPNPDLKIGVWRHRTYQFIDKKLQDRIALNFRKVSRQAATAILDVFVDFRSLS
jgi:hypothetical protein